MKEYRQNSHTSFLSFWALLCTAVAIVLFVHSHRIMSRMLKVEEILGGIALLMFGPAALAIYLIRARTVWVSIDRERGLLVSGRTLIPWEDLVRLERRRPALRDKSGPAEVSTFDSSRLPNLGGCGEGCFIGGGEVVLLIGILIAAFFAIWLLWFVLVPLIVIPVLEVFAPFGDRITLVTRRRRLVLRDLQDADDFMRELSLGTRGRLDP